MRRYVSDCIAFDHEGSWTNMMVVMMMVMVMVVMVMVVKITTAITIVVIHNLVANTACAYVQ